MWACLPWNKTPKSLPSGDSEIPHRRVNNHLENTITKGAPNYNEQSEFAHSIGDQSTAETPDKRNLGQNK